MLTHSEMQWSKEWQEKNLDRYTLKQNQLSFSKEAIWRDIKVWDITWNIIATLVGGRSHFAKIVIA